MWFCAKVKLISEIPYKIDACLGIRLRVFSLLRSLSILGVPEAAVIEDCSAPRGEKAGATLILNDRREGL